jgi:cysteine desulfurase/selenocysteine lyase
MIETVNISRKLDPYQIRKQFPLMDRKVKGRALVYFDNAATSQKPKVVIDTLLDYYTHYNANVHRGIHSLAEEATAAFEDSRRTAKQFIGAGSTEEIIFTRGTTEGINLVAFTWGRQNIKEKDEIIISTMEHHSNIVPWQILCEEKGAILKVIPINDQGELLQDEYEKLLGPRTKLVSIVHASNALGTINPVKGMIEAAHRRGAVVLVDGAQSAVHMDIDVKDLDCDFFVFLLIKYMGQPELAFSTVKKNCWKSCLFFRPEVK